MGFHLCVDFPLMSAIPLMSANFGSDNTLATPLLLRKVRPKKSHGGR